MTQDAATHAGEKDGRRLGVQMLLGAGAALMAVVGVAVVVAAADDASTYGVIFGVLVATLGLLTLAMLCLELRHRRRRPGASLGTTPDGGPATVVGRATWAVWIGVLSLVVLAGAPLAAAVVALGRGDVFLCGVLLVVGLWPASYLVPVGLGKVSAGGLYLTSDGLANYKDGGWWRVRWDDVDGVVAGEPLAVVVSHGAEVERGRRVRWGWGGDVRAPEGVLGIQTRHLAEAPGVISFLVLAYKERPDLRRQLGSPESLEWEILRPP